METLSVGMYYRTYSGFINKIISIKNFNEREYLLNGFYINKNTIKKFSYNIIDIMEKGDYLNGHRVEEIDFENEEIFTDSEYYCGIVEFCNIKSVITHEQMEQMAYKVGD